MMLYSVPTEISYVYLGYVSANIAKRKLQAHSLSIVTEDFVGKKEYVQLQKHIPQSRQNRDTLKNNHSNVFLLVANI